MTLSVARDYYGITLSSHQQDDRWHWQVSLPTGGVLTSNREYRNAEVALADAEHWLASEITFGALNVCMAELKGLGSLSHEEYCRMMQSVLVVTQHRGPVR